MNETKLHHTAANARPVEASASHIVEELQRYDDNLRDAQGLATGTRRDRIRVVGRLLRQKFEERAVDIAKLRPDDICR